MPIGIAGAILGGGIISGIGSLFGSSMQANAAQQASAEQVQLGEQALQTEQQLYNQGLAAQQGYVTQAENVANPIINQATGTGSSLISQGTSDIQNALSGAGSTGATLQSILNGGAQGLSTLESTPGYQYMLGYGTQAVQNLGTTTGLGANTLTAGANYAENLAQTNYSTITNALTSALAQQISGGNSISSTGTSLYNSGASLAGSLTSGLTGAGANALTAATNTGSQLASTLTGIGQSEAAGTTGSANALSSGISSATNSLSSSLLLGSLVSGLKNTNTASTNMGALSGLPQNTGYGGMGGWSLTTPDW